LVGQGYDIGEADGSFGEKTRKATAAFQKKCGLNADGVVGNGTYAQAMLRGFGAAEDLSIDADSTNWPVCPVGVRPMDHAKRVALFGAFTYESAPISGNPEAIKIHGDWVKKNIVSVEIPQLKNVRGAPKTGMVQLHRLVAPQFQAMFAAWEAAGLLDLVKTYDGGWVPRFVRGSRTSLSNHAFGSAIDINAMWNPLGTVPPKVGEPGSVRKLVEIAFEHGQYWGGWYPNGRPDGMHFEAREVKQ
jgi:hypothetical protein